MPSTTATRGMLGGETSQGTSADVLAIARPVDTVRKVLLPQHVPGRVHPADTARKAHRRYPNAQPRARSAWGGHVRVQYAAQGPSNQQQAHRVATCVPQANSKVCKVTTTGCFRQHPLGIPALPPPFTQPRSPSLSLPPRQPSRPAQVGEWRLCNTLKCL